MKPAKANKREQEKRIVSEMIGLYCKRHHKSTCLCPSCEELMAYTVGRSENCPFMETKTFCSNCRVHCYQPLMRERIRAVMRYAGPRMLLRHPVMAVRHLTDTIREKHLNIE